MLPRIAYFMLLFLFCAALRLCKTTKWEAPSRKKHVGRAKSKSSLLDDDSEIDVECKASQRNVVKSRRRKGDKSSKSRKMFIRKEDDGEVKKRRSKIQASLKGRRRVILPTRKEPLVSKAANSWKVLQDQLKTASQIAIKVTGSSTKQAFQAAQIVKRGMKSYFSSDFEALLLRLTRPDDQRPLKDDVERVIATVSTFVRNVDINSENNPYRVTLRKLWTKISEEDPRTTNKALYLLHVLLRHSDPDDSMIFKKLIEKMSKEFCKKSNSYYFKLSTKPLDDEVPLRKFAERYSAYVLRRAKAFTSHFEEMKLIGTIYSATSINRMKTKKQPPQDMECRQKIYVHKWQKRLNCLIRYLNANCLKVRSVQLP